MSYWKVSLSHAHMNVPGFKIGIEGLSDEIRSGASYHVTNETFISGHVPLNNVIETEKYWPPLTSSKGLLDLLFNRFEH